MSPSWGLAVAGSEEHTQIKRKTYWGLTEWEYSHRGLSSLCCGVCVPKQTSLTTLQSSRTVQWRVPISTHCQTGRTQRTQLSWGTDRQTKGLGALPFSQVHAPSLCLSARLALRNHLHPICIPGRLLRPAWMCSFYGFRDFSLQYYICPRIHIPLWNLELSQSIFCSYTYVHFTHLKASFYSHVLGAHFLPPSISTAYNVLKCWITFETEKTQYGVSFTTAACLGFFCLLLFIWFWFGDFLIYVMFAEGFYIKSPDTAVGWPEH